MPITFREHSIETHDHSNTTWFSVRSLELITNNPRNSWNGVVPDLGENVIRVPGIGPKRHRLYVNTAGAIRFIRNTGWVFATDFITWLEGGKPEAQSVGVIEARRRIQRRELRVRSSTSQPSCRGSIYDVGGASHRFRVRLSIQRRDHPRRLTPVVKIVSPSRLPYGHTDARGLRPEAVIPLHHVPVAQDGDMMAHAVPYRRAVHPRSASILRLYGVLICRGAWRI